MDLDLDVKVSTITLSTKIPNCQIILINVGKYLDIDNEILGIKYNFANFSVLKGGYLTTQYKKSKRKDQSKINKKLFYNQVSLVVKNGENNVNVKLFENGSLHLTGCKTILEGVKITEIIYEKLKSINTIFIKRKSAKH